MCLMIRRHPASFFFFFNDTATTEIYTLSLHDALPIFSDLVGPFGRLFVFLILFARKRAHQPDRKSTRLNSSHDQISYAVFCLKKKKVEAIHSMDHPSCEWPCRNLSVHTTCTDSELFKS